MMGKREGRGRRGEGQWGEGRGERHRRIREGAGVREEKRVVSRGRGT